MWPLVPFNMRKASPSDNEGGVVKGSFGSDPDASVAHEPQKALRVGVAYEITDLITVDISTETSKINLELMLLYQVAEADAEMYETARNERKSFQEVRDMAGDDALQAKPPTIELRNSLEGTQVLSERITDVYQAAGKWYICLSMQYRIACQHSFHIERFPFSREFLDLNFVCTQSASKVWFVPYDEAAPNGHERVNLYTGMTRIVQNWKVVNHFCHFWQADEVPPTRSGLMHHRFSVLLAVQFHENYLVCNCGIVVFLLSLLNALVFAESPQNFADRMTIIMTLALTMAAYKASMGSELPKKPSLTVADEYLLCAFCVNFLTAVFCGAEHFAIKRSWSTAERSMEGFEDVVVKVTTFIEGTFVSVVFGLWVFVHLLFAVLWNCGGCCVDIFFMPWERRRQIDVERLRADCDRMRSLVKQGPDVAPEAQPEYVPEFPRNAVMGLGLGPYRQQSREDMQLCKDFMSDPSDAILGSAAGRPPHHQQGLALGRPRQQSREEVQLFKDFMSDPCDTILRSAAGRPPHHQQGLDKRHDPRKVAPRFEMPPVVPFQ